MKPVILWVAFQSSHQANGGIESLSRVLEALTAVDSHIMTQEETPRTALWREKFQVHVVALPYPFGGGIWSGGLFGIFSRLVSYVRTNLRVWRLSYRHRVRAVVANDPAAFWHSCLGALISRARLILVLRDTLGSAATQSNRWRLAGLMTHRVVVLSDEMRNSWAPVLGPSAQIEVIPSIVDQRLFNASSDQQVGSREADSQGGAQPRVAYVGSMCEKKNQLDFIEKAMPALVAALPDLKLYFIGDAPKLDSYVQRCRTRVRELSLEKNVEFLGFQPDMGIWYRRVDLTILASRNEGLARSMLESLAAKTPVVSFDVASAREVLEVNACGLVVPQGDYPRFVAAMLSLLRSPKLRASYAERGFSFVCERFDSWKVAALYERMLLEDSHSTRISPNSRER